MAEDVRYWLRLTYIERDRLAMLSHLEVVSSIERVIRRAGLPFAVSQGFSPHMVKQFGPALPVGIGSTCEIFDVRLTRFVAADEALARLQAVSAPDLMIVRCEHLDPRAPSAQIAYPLATYEVQLSRAVAELPHPAEITVVRKKKGKTQERHFVVADFLHGDVRIGADDGASAGAGVSDIAYFTLEAKQDGSLRADVFLAECLKLANAQLAEGEEPLRALCVTRVKQEPLDAE